MDSQGSSGDACASKENSSLYHSEEIYQRMLDLEQELMEFQESSKELEQTLEEELRELESQNILLLSQTQIKDSHISELTKTVVRLNKEISELDARHTVREEENKTIIAQLKKDLVTVEILNDDMLSRDRILEQKLLLANQFNNELLERLAMTENDLENEREINARHQLTISNMENEILSTKLTRRKRDSTYQDLSMAEGTILDINEMLASEPPQPIKDRTMPRSDSLHKLHQLHSMSDVLLHKVGEMNTSLSLKSPSTTEITKPRSANGTTMKTAIHYSPSMKNLSRIQLVALSAKETPNTVLVSVAKPQLQTVSMTGKESITVEAKKKTRIKSVMKSFFHVE